MVVRTLTMNKIKKGDNVQILAGKDRSKQAVVERVSAKEGKVFLPSLNLSKRHVRKYRDIEGGIIDIAKPINISNVALVCPSCKKVTRVGVKIEGDVKMRICRKCQKEIK